MENPELLKLKKTVKICMQNRDGFLSGQLGLDPEPQAWNFHLQLRAKQKGPPVIQLCILLG